MLRIGDIALPSRCILAPMAGITDLPFRLLHRSFGCEFAFVEMVSARSLVHESGRTERMLATSPADKPIGVQLLGADPSILRRAVEIIEGYPFDILDFNAACPVKKVTARGEGAGLLREPGKLAELLRILVENARIPVTVKIRSGWDESSINAREVALRAEAAGIKALIIHGRTRDQGYRGRVDYRVIREVKESLRIPVVASGDTHSPQLIKRMFDETGCDGVTIARGALGNPWIFRETAEFLKDGTVPPRPDIDSIADTMVMHLKLNIEVHGERLGTMLFRKFFAWYTRGIFGMKALREKAFRAATKAQMIETIEEMRASTQ